MPIVLMEAVAGGTLSEFTTFATEILTWLVTTFQTVLTFLVGHPICLIGLIVSLIVTAIGTLRHLIGGSMKVDDIVLEVD